MSAVIVCIGLIALSVSLYKISVMWCGEIEQWRVAHFAALSVQSGEKDKSEFVEIPTKLMAIIQKNEDVWAQEGIVERCRELFKLYGNWDTVTSQIVHEIEQ